MDGATILLVDDEEVVRQLVSKVLKRHGYTVLGAADGTQALDVALHADGPIDLVITDMTMPHLSGPDLIRRLRQDHPQLRALLMSGYSDDRTTTSDYDYLSKPFSPQTLADKVKALLAS